MTKKLLCLLMSALIFTAIATTGAGANATVTTDSTTDSTTATPTIEVYKVELNGRNLPVELPTIQGSSGKTLVLLRGILGAVEAPFRYEASIHSVIVTNRNGRDITISVSTGAVNGLGVFEIATINERNFVETRFVEMACGFSIKQNKDTKTFEIETKEIKYREKPMIALTFDDGPGLATDRILNTLKENNAVATFFVIGNRVGSNKETLLKAVANGNEIAGHSWDHKNLTNLSDARVRTDLKSTDDAIYRTLGFRSKLFRPPYGSINSRVARIAGEEGFAAINWSVDPQDWRYKNANTVYNSIMSNVREGSIILAHDIHGTTATAMERVIPELIKRGYRLVTVSELLGEIEPGKIYTNG